MYHLYEYLQCHLVISNVRCVSRCLAVFPSSLIAPPLTDSVSLSPSSECAEFRPRPIEVDLSEVRSLRVTDQGTRCVIVQSDGSTTSPLRFPSRAHMDSFLDMVHGVTPIIRSEFRSVRSEFRSVRSEFRSESAQSSDQSQLRDAPPSPPFSQH